MLQVKNLTIIQTQDQRILLPNLSFSVRKGQRMAVIGAEGDGKSSLLKLIYNPKLVEDYLSWEGDINYSPYRIAYLAQETPEDMLKQDISELFWEHSNDSALYTLAGELGLDAGLLFAPRKLETCSGGERLKLRLLLLLLDKPDLLLLDEPGNDLDLEGLAWLEQFLKQAPEAILYVSHDEVLLANTATAILHIEQIWRRTEARVSVSGLGFTEYMEQFHHSIERQNKLAANEERAYRKKMERFYALQNKIDHDLNQVSRQDPATGRMLKKKMQSVKSMGRRFDREHERQTPETDREDEPDFFLSDLPTVPSEKEIIRFAAPELKIGSRVLAKDIELTVRGPERIGITGANGSGKTTLLQAIYAELRERKDISVFYMPQNFDQDGFPLDFLVPDGAIDRLQEASDLLGGMHFARAEVTRPIRELSGGQKVKLLFAKLRLEQPHVLLLDEPTRHLSPLTNPVFRRSLADFGGTIISVSHDRRYLSEVCSRVLRFTPEGLVEEDPALYQQ